MDNGCLLVIARSGDPAVDVLRAQAPRRLVMHATVPDLSRAGWRYEIGDASRLSACAAGRVLRAFDIAAVLCRVGAVTPADLPHIHDDDRVYVAAEMNAFLHAWLMQFSGVRFNEPSWVSLSGPSWHPLQWTWMLERLNIPVAPPLRRADASAALPKTVATVIGADVFVADDAPLLADQARTIALAARSELLAVTFVQHDGVWKFLGADPCPKLSPVTGGALVRHAFAERPSMSIRDQARATCDAA